MSVVVNTVKVALSGVTVANGAGGGSGAFGGIPVLGVNHLDNFAPFKVNSNGHVLVEFGTSPVPITDNGGSLTVDGTVGITVGTSSTGLGKVEDTPHSTGDVGVAVWGVRNDNAATTHAANNGDYSAIAVDATGTLLSKSPYRPTPYKLNSAASTNATSVSATANTLLMGYYISNTNSSVRYVKFYNKASAPTVGTDTPVLVLAIPGSGAANVSFPAGVNFSTGLAFATTTGAADSDTGAVALNEIIVNLVYVTY